MFKATADGLARTKMVQESPGEMIGVLLLDPGVASTIDSRSHRIASTLRSTFFKSIHFYFYKFSFHWLVGLIFYIFLSYNVFNYNILCAYKHQWYIDNFFLKLAELSKTRQY